MPVSCKFTISQHIVDGSQRLDIRIASSVLIRKVIMRERPHLSWPAHALAKLSAVGCFVTHLLLHRLYYFLHRYCNDGLTL